MPDPDVEWVDGRLVSKRFRDIYFAHDGPAETRRVFIEPAKLRQRIQVATTFTLVELGFGSGLNFLTLARLLEDAECTTRLRYVAIENYPLYSTDLARAVRPFENELAQRDELVRQLPPRVPGWHRRYFNEGQLELSLFYGDVKRGLNDIQDFERGGVDAWFLDGFSPERNPEMWESAIFAAMRAMTKPNGTATTFSATGHVRRGLQANGFEVQRVKGAAGAKRHTTVAKLTAPAYQPPDPIKKVRVVGGGFAGTTLARTFALKGVRVELIERHPRLGSETSAIPAAIQHPRLSAADTPLAQFRVHAYAHAEAMLAGRAGVTPLGGLHLPDDGMSQDRLAKVADLLGPTWLQWLDADAIRDLTRGAIQESGALHPKSSVIDGAEVCDALASHERITVTVSTSSEFVFDNEIPTVYATGCELPPTIQDVPLETLVIPGQVDAFAIAPPLRTPTTIIVKNGYVAPQVGLAYAGSTYEYQRWPANAATRANAARITGVIPNARLHHQLSFRSRRVVASDRLPIVGAIGERTWCSWGHGSGGTISAPFAAELLASAILGEIPVSSAAVVRLLSPERFRLRQARRPNPLSREFHQRPQPIAKKT